MRWMRSLRYASIHARLAEMFGVPLVCFCYCVSSTAPHTVSIQLWRNSLATQRMVQDALENARKGRTTVVVAHRLSTVMVCVSLGRVSGLARCSLARPLGWTMVARMCLLLECKQVQCFSVVMVFGSS